MNISTVMISQILIDIGTIANTNKWEVAFLLARLHLVLAHSKGQGQDHAHLECEYL